MKTQVVSVLCVAVWEEHSALGGRTAPESILISSKEIKATPTVH